jgi:hypothetical protein
MADEMRAGLIENPLVQTPNLSALAKDSVFFAQNFSVSPVCGPSRIANFTGLYPHVSGHRSLYQLLRPHEENLFKQLKDHGYCTVMAGKNDMMTEASLRSSFSHRLEGPQGATLRLMRTRLRRIPFAKKVKLLRLAFRLFVIEHKTFINHPFQAVTNCTILSILEKRGRTLSLRKPTQLFSIPL